MHSIQFSEFRSLIQFRNQMYVKYFIQLFYEKYNHTIVSYRLFTYFFEYMKYHNSQIQLCQNKVTPYYTKDEVQSMENELSYLMDDHLMKHLQEPKDLLPHKLSHHNRNNTYFIANHHELFCKKMSYDRNYYPNEQTYHIEFDLFDKLMEIYIQYILYEECKYIRALSRYHPIPEIKEFYSYIDVPKVIDSHLIDSAESIPLCSNMYIHMENVGTLTFDRYLYQLISSKPALSEDEKGEKIRKVCKGYIEVCKLLRVLQRKFSFVHGDLKGSNIVLREKAISIIDFEFSYMKVGDQHIYAQEKFLFDENYDPFEKKTYILSFCQLYGSKYAKSSDFLYLLLASLHPKNPLMGPIVSEFFMMKNKDHHIVNIFSLLIQNKNPYEAFVYSKDFPLLERILKTCGVSFEEFIMQFQPDVAIHKLEHIIGNQNCK